MANMFRHLRTSVAGRQPTIAQMETGQIAMNYRDEYLFIRNVDDEIVIIGSSTSVSRAMAAVLSVNTILPDANGNVTIGPSNIGANGVPYLDINGKILTQFLPESVVGGLQYKGEWNASTNTPTLPDPTTAQNWYYIVSMGGTYLGTTYRVGDWIISNGTEWQKIDNQNDVVSVAGKTGIVTLETSDIASGVFIADRLGASAGNNMVLTTDGTGNPTWVARSTISGVTSIGMTVPAALLSVSPATITSTGTFAVTLPARAANLVFAGPATGADATPTFRVLAPADIPALDTSKITAGVFAPARLAPTPGNDQVLTTDATGNPEWVAKSTIGQPGTVTSVGMSVPSTLLAVTGSPVTTSGTLAVTLPARAANLVFAGPTTGADAAPVFRGLVADDIPTLDEGTF